LAFSIRDTGIGIPEDQLETVLQPFVQSDSSIQRRFGGSGLGLSISKQLIELMHGRIDVSSQVHVGSAFNFTLRFGEAQGPQPVFPVLRVSRQLRTMLYTLDQATQETVHDSLTLAGLSVETYEQPLEMIQQLLQGDGGQEVLVCLGGSRHQLDRIYQMLSRFIEHQPELGKKIRVVLFTSDLQERGFLGSVFEKQGRVLSNVVSRRELIQSMTALFDDEPPLDDERQQPGEALTQAGDGNDLTGYSVLVVDDNQINLCLEQVILNNHGAQTTSATDGLSALNCAKRSQFDLILMDVQMPGMSGNEATACIRQLEGHAHTLIVALTADITDEGKRACLQAGMNAVVTKPFDAKKLVQLIKSHSLLAQGTADSDY
jgi:CheY-like chemotaxis protein